VPVVVVPPATGTKPSFLLPPGKNGAAAHAIFERRQQFSVKLPSVSDPANPNGPLSMRNGDGTQTARRECDGIIEELEAPFRLRFTEAAACVDSATLAYREDFPLTPSSWKPVAPDFSFATLFYAFPYSPVRDTYYVDVAATAKDLTIGPNAATVSIASDRGGLAGTPSGYAVTGQGKTFSVTFQY
jgi:hypothetical protein